MTGGYLNFYISNYSENRLSEAVAGEKFSNLFNPAATNHLTRQTTGPQATAENRALAGYNPDEIPF